MSKSSLHPALHRAHIKLDSLPHGSVILDRYGQAWQQSRRYWYHAFGDSSEVNSWELAQRGPVTTIWNPETV